ncbi:MAG: serine/threonine protein kinase [Proteobacteria bacterium]|nr:serine/threonine protein kinase [Pseudomonadota bacterium]
MTPSVPSDIGGYRVLGVLGTGAFSRVYRVVRMAGGGFRKELALKVLAPGIEPTPDLRNMFIEEASVAAWLHHRNIVGVHEFGIVPGGVFIVMELVDGLDLRTFLRRLRGRKSWLPLPAAVHIVVQALHGLHHAHTRRDGAGKPLRIVHRDLKPDNILLSVDGGTKVSDFGLARIRTELEEGTSAGFTRGTARFMSPEQATGRPVDARSDVFSAGILLYMLLASRLPFVGKTDLDTMRAVARAQFQPIQLARPHVPDALARSLHRMLAPSPDSRYGSALEAAEALADGIEDLVREPPERGLARQLAGAIADPIEDTTLGDGFIAPTEL